MKKIFLLILIIIFTVIPTSAKNKDVEQDNTKETLQYLNLDWWQNFHDEILTEHLRTLYKQNYDLKNTELKIKENEKLVKMQFASELPQLYFDGFIGRDFRSSVQKFGTMEIPSYAQNNFQFPLTAGYEIDIWGKNRLKTKSLKENLEIIKQAQRATYISLSSDFCADYYNLIKTDRLLEIQNELIKIQEEIVDKINDKYNIGLCSLNEVLKEEKLLSSLKEEKNNFEDKREILENLIRAYLSMGEGDLLRSHFSDVKVLDNIPNEINSDVIKERPDFLQQEANIKRVGYDVKIARKEMLPSFVIFGQIGLNAYKFSDLFKTSTQLANAGITPTFDIFSGGRKLAFLKIKKYQYEEALNNYQKTIFEDIKEVNTALAEVNKSKKNYNEALNKMNVENKIFNLVQNKEKIGSASKLDILYAKESNLMAEKEKVSNTINYLISTISLYKATGGINLYTLNSEYI